ncbi:hypothetical protein NKG05_19535 [Oerskovia sp. M15]
MSAARAPRASAAAPAAPTDLDGVELSTAGSASRAAAGPWLPARPPWPWPRAGRRLGRRPQDRRARRRRHRHHGHHVRRLGRGPPRAGGHPDRRPRPGRP